MERVSCPLRDRRACRLIRGYFNESLTAELSRKHHFRPALFVDVDVDLHSSTIHVLSWLLANKLLVPGVSYVRYDDWRKPQQWWGEAAAHRQISEAYKLKWRKLSMKEYQLLSIGASLDGDVDFDAVKERLLTPTTIAGRGGKRRGGAQGRRHGGGRSRR